MQMPDVIPLSWKIGASLALCGVLWAGYEGWHHHVYQQGRTDERTDRAAADAKAVGLRLTENIATEKKQSADNAEITKAKNEELAPVVARIASAPRLRVGTAVCRPAPAPDAQSSSSSPVPDPEAGMVRPDVDRDIRALKIKVEEAFATGRACQAFLEKNGLVP